MLFKKEVSYQEAIELLVKIKDREDLGYYIPYGDALITIADLFDTYCCEIEKDIAIKGGERGKEEKGM